VIGSARAEAKSFVGRIAAVAFVARILPFRTWRA
jgi:hypothetical protein